MTKKQEKLNEALLEASKNGGLNKVKNLIEEKGADVEARDADDRTPLHWASANGHLEAVKYLIEAAKADVEARNFKGVTSLHLACINGQLKVVKYLIEEAQAEVDASDDYEQTPLHFATKGGKYTVIKYLIEKGAEVDARDNMDHTPLYYASINEYVEVITYLLLAQNSLMPIKEIFKYPDLIKKKIGRETEAQSIFDYLLQNKSKYKPEEIQEFKKEFLKFQMNEEDSRNLKPIMKFL